MEKKEERKKKSPISIIFNIIFYLFIIAVLVLAVCNIMGAKEGEHPSIFGYSTYYIMTGSMEPNINPGSLVVVKNGVDQSIKAGDVITFRGITGETITTHRVNKVIDNGTEFITKGDANKITDPVPVKEGQIIGKVVFHIPYLGKVSQFIQKNLIAVIIVILALFGIGVIIDKARSKSIK